MSPTPTPRPQRLVRSAGALVWRFSDPQRTPTPGDIINPADIEVLMVHRPRYRDWSWPKGKTEHGEGLVAAAVREVEEETGATIALGSPLTTQRYRLGSGQTKEVHYWVGTLLPEDHAATRLRIPTARAPRSEIDHATWVHPTDAYNMLTRRGDRRLLTEIESRAREGRLITTTVLLTPPAAAPAPHAQLSRLGLRQAIDMIDLLSAYGIDQSLTVPWVSARRTLAPWAAAGGGSVALVDTLLLDEAAPTFADDLARVRAFAAKQLRAHTSPLLICAGGAAGRGILDEIRAHTPATVGTETSLEPGRLVIAHVEHADAIPVVGAFETQSVATKDPATTQGRRVEVRHQ